MQRNKDYLSKKWKIARAQALELDKHLCQRCLGNFMPDGSERKMTKAVLVHHIFPLKKYPKYKYKLFVEINGKKERNLISLCNDCHEIIEGRRNATPKGFNNIERFD